MHHTDTDTPIQTVHPLHAVPVKTGRACLYRSGCIDLNALRVVSVGDLDRDEGVETFGRSQWEWIYGGMVFLCTVTREFDHSDDM